MFASSIRLWVLLLGVVELVFLLELRRGGVFGFVRERRRSSRLAAVRRGGRGGGGVVFFFLVVVVVMVKVGFTFGLDGFDSGIVLLWSF